MPSMIWLLAILTIYIMIALVNKLTKGAVYGTLQIAGILTLAVIVVTFLSVYEFIADHINHVTQIIEKWWNTAAVLSLVLMILICLSIWAWVFWGWLFNL